MCVCVALPAATLEECRWRLFGKEGPFFGKKAFEGTKGKERERERDVL